MEGGDGGLLAPGMEGWRGEVGDYWHRGWRGGGGRWEVIGTGGGGVEGGDGGLLAPGVEGGDGGVIGTHVCLSLHVHAFMGRYLARKYLTIWARRVFGRVLPSAARLHHETAVQRRVFSVWYEQWWVVRREWKLNIRADCHNR